MTEIRNTLSSKLTSLIWLTTGSALLVASIGITLYEFVSYQRVLLYDLSTKAELIGQSASAALHFTDATAAQDVISIFQVDSAILDASLYDQSGKRLAIYTSDTTDTTLPETVDLEAKSQYIALLFVEYTQPITFEGETVGGLFIRQSLTPFYARQLRHLLILTLVLLMASVVVAVISPRLKEEITLPILNLAETSRAISERQDYAMRVSYQSRAGNELMILAEAFNEMLAQIEARDQSLATYRDHLEEMVQEQTAYLYEHNIDLQHAIEQAEEASRFKSIVLDNLTHEFRTPLNGILGITAFLRDESAIDMDELIEMLDMIDTSGNRLLAVLTALLNLASLEKHSSIYSYSILDMDEELKNVIPFYEGLACEQGLTFNVEINQLKKPIRFAPKTFHMLLEPLLSNAFKFTQSGKVVLGIKADVSDLEISVEDTGKGIDPSFIEDMFTPFAQESNGLSRSHEGTGIGLAIVKRISDLHSGAIEVRSEVGSGTTISVTLPLAESPQSSFSLQPTDSFPSKLEVN